MSAFRLVNARLDFTVPSDTYQRRRVDERLVDGRDVAVAATELGVELAIASKIATTDPS